MKKNGFEDPHRFVFADEKNARSVGSGVKRDGTAVVGTRLGEPMSPRFEEDARLLSRAYLFWKRGIDLVLSAFLLLLLALPMFLIAVWIRADSSGPAIFRQTRVGRGLSTFTICKFRTMTVSAPHDRPSAMLSPQERESSLTRAGRFLRRTGLDELPQLWNVLCGEMSLVGPRPVIPRETRLTALRAALGAMSVRPGITGLAQVSGRDDCGIEEKAYMDALYARRVSFHLDLRIVFLTVRTLFRGEGCN